MKIWTVASCMVCDGIGYVAVDDTEEDEITVSLDIFLRRYKYGYDM